MNGEAKKLYVEYCDYASFLNIQSDQYDLCYV